MASPEYKKTIFGNVSLRSKSSGRSVSFPNLGAARERGEIGLALLLANVHTAGHQFNLTHTVDAPQNTRVITNETRPECVNTTVWDLLGSHSKPTNTSASAKYLALIIWSAQSGN